MAVEALIESYVSEVTARLPRSKRADIASELSALLVEELSARAEAAGRAPDEAMALELLRGFGRPAEVAARYGPSIAILDPADTRDFLVAAVAGSLALLGLGRLTLQQPPQNWPAIVVMSWLGFLVLLFGSLHWARRRRPALSRWRPRERESANRVASLLLVVVIASGTIAYGAPAWLFAKLTGGLRLSPWLAYADDFQRWRLPWLLVLWSLAAMLFLWVAVEGRWRPLTRRIEAALQVGVSAVLIWFLAAGPMFRTPEVDHAVKIGLLIAVVVILADAAFKIRRLADRPRPPADFISQRQRPHAG
ncbi:MAG: hypothetical protein ACHP84_15165 [Caulobacterales bacterium]